MSVCSVRRRPNMSLFAVLTLIFISCTIGTASSKPTEAQLIVDQINAAINRQLVEQAQDAKHPLRDAREQIRYLLRRELIQSGYIDPTLGTGSARDITPPQP